MTEGTSKHGMEVGSRQARLEGWREGRKDGEGSGCYYKNVLSIFSIISFIVINATSYIYT